MNIIQQVHSSSFEEGRKEVLSKWDDAIFYSEEGFGKLDAQVMDNHFNQAKIGSLATNVDIKEEIKNG